LSAEGGRGAEKDSFVAIRGEKGVRNRPQFVKVLRPGRGEDMLRHHLKKKGGREDGAKKSVYCRVSGKKRSELEKRKVGAPWWKGEVRISTIF